MCLGCKKSGGISTEAALPKSDIDWSAVTLVAYLWWLRQFPFREFRDICSSFFRWIFHSGHPRWWSGWSDILSPVWDEILEDVKGGMIIFATRQAGRQGLPELLWHLPMQSAFYWLIEDGAARGWGILGNIFFWSLGYRCLVCISQDHLPKATCMAHLSQIRKFMKPILIWGVW